MVVEIEGRRHRVGVGMTVYIPGDAEHGCFASAGGNGEEGCKWLYVFPDKFEGVEYRFRSEGAYEEGSKAKL
jgi:hypothetical protein